MTPLTSATIVPEELVAAPARALNPPRARRLTVGSLPAPMPEFTPSRIRCPPCACAAAGCRPPASRSVQRSAYASSRDG